MHTVSLSEAITDLANLVDAACSGEEILIAKDERTGVQLVPRQLRNGRTPVKSIGSMSPKPARKSSAFGKYAGMGISSEEHARLKQEEIALEDQPR